MADGQATKDENGKKVNLFKPVGVSGLPRYAGYVFDEWLPELQGPRGRKTLREMSDNSATIGALKFAMEMLIRQVSWMVAPGTDDEEGKDLAKFVLEALHDMETPWEDTLADILTMFDYGWSLFETPYKRRDGKVSKHEDGKIGWLGWQMRGQETLLRWDYDDFHATFPNSFVQLGPPDFVEHTVPLDRCLLFRTTTRRANPEGRSLWRNAYHAWFMVKHLEAIEAIGSERDLAGLPIGLVPSEILSPDASPEQVQMRQAWEELITRIRRDEQEGILAPSDRDELGNLIWEIKLLTTGGQRQFDLGAVIERYEQRILMTCLADFIMLGHTNVGTQSLGKTKIELFSTAISAYLSLIAAQVNDVAIPRLLKINGIKVARPPTLQHGQVERMDLDVLGNYIYQLQQAGFLLNTDPQGALTNYLLEQAHLPLNPEGLHNPFPDQWADVMPNPDGLPPNAANFQWSSKDQKPPALQVPPVSTQAPAANPVRADGGQQNQPVQEHSIAGPKRPSLKVPNQPRAPRAEPPHVHRGPLEGNGQVAKADRNKRRRIGTTEATQIALQFNEQKPDGLNTVAFDLDNTALHFPEVFVPLANYLDRQGVKVGVITGNRSPEARAMWERLGYPEPSFYFSHPASDTDPTAQWKADICKKLDVDMLIDDFSGGRGRDDFKREIQAIGGDTVALEVELPDSAALQHVG